MASISVIGNDALVINAFISLANMAPGKTNFDYHREYIRDNGGATGYKAALNEIFAGISDADMAAAMLDNLGLRDVAGITLDIGTAYLAGNAADRVGAVLNLAKLLSVYSGADTDLIEARDAYNQKVEWSYNWSGVQANAAPSHFPDSFPGNTLHLTAAVETLIGSAADDIFQGNLAVSSNTLNSGDILQGGAGNDTLKATLDWAESGALRAITSSIEKVLISAQNEGDADNGDNNVADSNALNVDAHEMQGVNWWEDNNSRQDLIVEDVRIKDDQITKDITIAMVETDPGLVDYGVYFDPYSLRAGSSATSVLRLELLDTRSAAAGTGPLKDNPYWGFGFFLDGVAQVVTSTGIDTASAQVDLTSAYTELRDAIAARIAELVGAGNTALAGVTVSLGEEFQRYDTQTGELVTGIAILLTDGNGGVMAVDNTVGWQTQNGTVPPNSGLHTLIQPYDPNVVVDLVTSKVILDDVGRGSNGGDLVIGSLSVGETSASKGVERFEIEVRDNSRLQTVQSTNNTLLEVTIVNGITTSHVVDPKHTGVNTDENAGDLYVLGPNGADAALPGTTNTAGFTDVRLIDGSAMTGSLTMTANITSASIAKYLNLVDTAASPSGDNIPFVYSGGTNADNMSVVVDGALIGSTGTLGAREDFTFTLNGNAGNDALSVRIADGTNWYTDQAMLNNVAINGGDGDDTINKPGSGDVVINAGSGTDTVYSDNTGSDANVINAGKAVWVVGAANLEVDDLVGDAANDNTLAHFLYKGKLTVSFSGATTSDGGGVTAGAADAVLAAFDNGWEVTVDIPTGANYLVNQYYLNQAIKAAINNDAVLKKLLVVQDGPVNTLIIKSLIDGQFAATDLDFDITAPDLTVIGAGGLASASEQTTVLDAWKNFGAAVGDRTIDSGDVIADAQNHVTRGQLEAVADLLGTLGVGTALLGQDGAVDLTGADSAAATDNIIEMGLGDDVLVMSTSILANETLDFNGYDLGKDTIVNFQDDSTNADHDVLDYTAYLTSMDTVSGSSLSQRHIDVNYNAANTAVTDVNSVTIFDGVVFTTTETFAGLTAANLLAAIQSTNVGTSDWANIGSATMDASHGYAPSGAGSLVGKAGKAVVMIENDMNDGEYKVFELSFDGTTDNTTADYTGVKLIATLDFGNSLAAFDIDNLVL